VISLNIRAAFESLALSISLTWGCFRQAAAKKKKNITRNVELVKHFEIADFREGKVIASGGAFALCRREEPKIMMTTGAEDGTDG
jgi:hypothetical protein